ncbi:MAG: DUF2283 domain-containing protein [Nitrospirae bacterium]|nr:DUF2283 domain-containing protein [Nitrospirota bacterium]
MTVIVRMKYYNDTDSLYIDLSEKTSVSSFEILPGIVIDFDESDNIAGIDIDKASTIVKLDTMDVVNIPYCNVGK